eukprot:scaffold133122_cov51-Phaeocystis_antarctica.AAC.1
MAADDDAADMQGAERCGYSGGERAHASLAAFDAAVLFKMNRSESSLRHCGGRFGVGVGELDSGKWVYMFYVRNARRRVYNI